MFFFESILRLTNALFTIGIGLYLFYLYKSRSKKKTKFISLLAWSLAFTLYGFEIFARIWLSHNSIIVAILSFIMAPLFVLGTSNLMRKNRIYLPISLVLLSITIYLYSIRVDEWWDFGILAFYGVTTAAMIHLRFSMGKLANRLIAGWFTLLIVNIIFLSIFDIVWMADLFVIPAKVLLTLGMLDQRFAQMVYDIKKMYKSISSSSK